jgi:hypothetical protein
MRIYLSLHKAFEYGSCNFSFKNEKPRQSDNRQIRKKLFGVEKSVVPAFVPSIMFAPSIVAAAISTPTTFSLKQYTNTETINYMVYEPYCDLIFLSSSLA